ncbi:zinc-binding dehydrogenase [Catenulispora rubra]|uniref:zinc-binding dehydrogenase n=1 Tax=Catenulispora rubra TaxID=280293 RepID=UPI001891F68D|nr:zinc-binding dehydrogenase [Catenulispora rubra]
MKAVIATGLNTLADSLEITDVPEPEPQADEAVVAVEAFSVNRGEALFLTGGYGRPADKGWRPGQDIAGVVVRAAADGSGPAVGTRVVGHPEGTGWAERVAVPTGRLAELPDAVSATTAAALPLAGLTALRLVRAAGDIVGRRALVTAAAGGVGFFLTELLAGAGAEIVAVTSNDTRAVRLREFGAAQVVKRAADAGGRYDLVFESVGGQEFADAVGKAAPGATVLWYGQAGLKAPTLDFFSLMASTPLTVKHFPHWISPVTDGQDIATLVRLVGAGRLHPEVGRVADWADTAQAVVDVYERRVQGNAVLTID